MQSGQQPQAEAQIPVHTSDQQEKKAYTFVQSPTTIPPSTPPTSKMPSQEPTLRQSKRARRTKTAIVPKTGVEKSMETCVQMMIGATLERQQRNFLAQQQDHKASMEAQRPINLDTMREQGE